MEIFALARTRSHPRLGGIRMSGARLRSCVLPVNPVSVERDVPTAAQPVQPVPTGDIAVVAVKPAFIAPQVAVPLSRLHVKSLT
ncbi:MULTISPECIES: hypothetical protein [Thermocrispum]|uniref:Uncharacterized protein n=1 Tax=Thermocrispum agreste TaxID=37925 RepID=A0ABD6FDC3_9PSEU|nr:MULTISPECIES: hypothetical protein [Thermocrispum]